MAETGKLSINRTPSAQAAANSRAGRSAWVSGFSVSAQRSWIYSTLLKPAETRSSCACTTNGSNGLLDDFQNGLEKIAGGIKGGASDLLDSVVPEPKKENRIGQF